MAANRVNLTVMNRDRGLAESPLPRKPETISNKQFVTL